MHEGLFRLKWHDGNSSSTVKRLKMQTIGSPRRRTWANGISKSKKERKSLRTRDDVCKSKNRAVVTEERLQSRGPPIEEPCLLILVLIVSSVGGSMVATGVRLCLICCPEFFELHRSCTLVPRSPFPHLPLYKCVFLAGVCQSSMALRVER